MHGPPLRSVLYVPGSNPRALEKASGLPVDGLILDLEDAVAPQAKDSAREAVCAAARSGAYGTRTVAIRVNAAGSPWHAADVEAVGAAGPDAVLLPKVAGAGDVLTLQRTLQAQPAAARTQIWAMLETPMGVLRSAEIAAAAERLSVLVVGTNDLLAELGAADMPGREPLLASLSLCLLAARAAGRTILDGVHNGLRDAGALERECLAARRLGFDGKTLIHPDQIDACNRAFTPTAEEIAQARRLIEAFEQAQRAGGGVATLDGRLVESLHVETARRLLALAARPTAVNRG